MNQYFNLKFNLPQINICQAQNAQQFLSIHRMHFELMLINANMISIKSHNKYYNFPFQN